MPRKSGISFFYPKLKNGKIMRMKIFILLATIFFSISNIFAGETGKISGVITDSQTGETILGANIIIEGTYYGAAADIDGYYFINNVPPGKYNLIVSYVGYVKTVIRDVIVKIDLTTKVNVKLTLTEISLGQDVVVTAERPLVTKDLTSSKSSVSSEEIKMMPVENLDQVVNLQAGVVAGHFRGGRSGEVAYLIDGIPVNDAYNGSRSVQVENDAIRELEVISGTFNAEYGQAMSGVVNIVTQEGGEKFNFTSKAYFGTSYTNDTDIFYHLDEFGSNLVQDYNFTISGPLMIIPNLSFFVNGRYVDDDGYLFGTRYYKTTDFFPFSPTGDSSGVAMNDGVSYSMNSNISYNSKSWKLNYTIFWNDYTNRYYNHYYRWTPDGLRNHYRQNYVHNLSLSLYPSETIYSTIKLSYNKNDYQGYLFEDPYDSQYLDPTQGLAISGYTFRTGGQQSDRYERYTDTYLGIWTLESQLSKEHKLKFGLEGRYYELFDHNMTMVNSTEGEVDDDGNEIFTLGYRQPGAAGNQSYTKNPFSFSAYLQDKMEYDIMIINAGIRFDYFNSNTTLPADLRNPYQYDIDLTDNLSIKGNPNFPGAGEVVDAEAKFQVSPRLGFSFPISEEGAIYFSYGHFFQLPEFQYLYLNKEYIVTAGQSLASTIGNPNLEAQKTVKYELGLQQVLFPNVGAKLSVYYSDIRNLLGMEIINTYEGFKYGRYINKDYGNVKGFIVSIEKRFVDYFGGRIDYTFQLAEGNSSDPMTVFYDNQTDPPVETEKRVVPLDWDQNHTLNVNLNVGEPGDWSVGIVYSFGSGTPYTEDITWSNGIRFINGSSKPQYHNVDLKADKYFEIFGIDLHTYLLVYNVFDIRNEVGVYSSTGRATNDLNTQYAGDIFGLNTIQDYINNPQMYSAPRQIRLGLSFGL